MARLDILFLLLFWKRGKWRRRRVLLWSRWVRGHVSRKTYSLTWKCLIGFTITLKIVKSKQTEALYMNILRPNRTIFDIVLQAAQIICVEVLCCAVQAISSKKTSPLALPPLPPLLFHASTHDTYPGHLQYTSSTHVITHAHPPHPPRVVKGRIGRHVLSSYSTL